MKKRNLYAIILLIFTGLSAVIGSIMLISDPTGASIGMDTDLLRYTPFKNFLIPAILLLIVNGICSTVVAMLMIRNLKYSSKLVAMQGLVSLIWIITQVILIRVVLPVHFLYGCIALVLLILGTTADRNLKKPVGQRPDSHE